MLWKPQDQAGDVNGERNRDQDNHIDRQRRLEGLRETSADKFCSHQQRETVWRCDEPEGERRDQHDSHVHRVDVGGLPEVSAGISVAGVNGQLYAHWGPDPALRPSRIPSPCNGAIIFRRSRTCRHGFERFEALAYFNSRAQSSACARPPHLPRNLSGW
jgi:hypothetical protein